jgi:serine/threonine-protein kinase
VFGRYRLLDLLGRGGMGEVWKAYDTETDRVVAVKVLLGEFADNDQYKQRFRREARAAAGLNEPHVVPIHNYGDIEGRLYVDMRLIEGRDLASILRTGPMDPQRAVEIVGQVASALNAAHRIGLVHRDVKPSNILIGEGDFAYLIDFGIARAADDLGLTNTGVTIGTWAYMAPERFGAGIADARSDVYALACVLHEALTGRRPYPGDSIEQQIAGHLTQPPPRPSTFRDGIPTAFDSVIAAGLAKSPDQRFSSTTALANAAREAVTAPILRQRPEPIQPPTQQASWQPRPEPRRPQWQPPPPHDPRPVAHPKSPLWRHPAVVISALAAVAIVALGVAFAVRGSGNGTHVATDTTPSTTTTTATTTTTTSPPPSLNLDTLLPIPAELDTMLGASGMAVNKGGASLLDDEETVSPPECRGPVFVNNKIELANTPVVGTRWQNLSEPPPNATHAMVQSVVQTANPSAAMAFLDAQAASWRPCDGKQVVGTNIESGKSFTYDFSAFAQRPDMITMAVKGPGQITCQHAVGVRGSYVGNVSVCGLNITNQAESVVNAILAKVIA